jgi:ribosomal protein L1
MVTRNETTRAVEELLEALAELRQATRATEVGIRRALQRAHRGVDVATAVSALDPATTRNAMNDALKAVEQARHEMRLAVFAKALDQGTSIGELGRIFGFSRQLAARYAKEARGRA